MKFLSNVIQFVIFAHFSMEDQYKILLLKRAPDRAIYPNLWQICTGRSEEGETALQTGLRELEEETGIQNYIKLWSVPKVPVYFSTNQDAICFSPVFAVQVNENTEISISHEHTEFGWFTFEEAKEMTFIPSYHDAMQYIKDYIINSKMPDLYLINGNKND
jgi:dATP pyrophosphohydrolase